MLGQIYSCKYLNSCNDSMVRQSVLQTYLKQKIPTVFFKFPRVVKKIDAVLFLEFPISKKTKQKYNSIDKIKAWERKTIQTLTFL